MILSGIGICHLQEIRILHILLLRFHCLFTEKSIESENTPEFVVYIQFFVLIFGLHWDSSSIWQKSSSKIECRSFLGNKNRKTDRIISLHLPGARVLASTFKICSIFLLKKKYKLDIAHLYNASKSVVGHFYHWNHYQMLSIKLITIEMLSMSKQESSQQQLACRTIIYNICRICVCVWQFN